MEFSDPRVNLLPGFSDHCLSDLMKMELYKITIFWLEVFWSPLKYMWKGSCLVWHKHIAFSNSEISMKETNIFAIFVWGFLPFTFKDHYTAQQIFTLDSDNFWIFIVGKVRIGRMDMQSDQLSSAQHITSKSPTYQSLYKIEFKAWPNLWTTPFYSLHAT